MGFSLGCMSRPATQGEGRQSCLSKDCSASQESKCSTPCDMQEPTQRPMSIEVCKSSGFNATDVQVWMERGTEIENLAQSLKQPSALLTAIVLDSIGRLTPSSSMQHPLLRDLLLYLDAPVYFPKEATTLRPPMEEISTKAIPQRYA